MTNEIINKLNKMTQTTRGKPNKKKYFIVKTTYVDVDTGEEITWEEFQKQYYKLGETEKYIEKNDKSNRITIWYTIKGRHNGQQTIF